MKNATEQLLELAKNILMNDEQREEQRRSFAFGNSNIANNSITRDFVNKQADTMRNLCRQSIPVNLAAALNAPKDGVD